MELDDLLDGLRTAQVPAALAELDGAALAGVARARTVAVHRTSVAAAVGALLLGLGSTAVPSTAALAAPAMPLGAPMPLAPSSLLAY